MGTSVLFVHTHRCRYQARYHPRSLSSYPSFVSTVAIAELRAIEWADNGVRVGVATTINGLIHTLKSSEVARTTPYKNRGFTAICNLLAYFANNQVRDMGTLGGSLVTCDPLSDLYPALVSLVRTVIANYTYFPECNSTSCFKIRYS